MVSQNFNFILTNDLSKYAGQWIAVAKNRVVAKGGSASEVIAKADKVTKKKSTIMRVPKDNQILLL